MAIGSCAKPVCFGPVSLHHRRGKAPDYNLEFLAGAFNLANHQNVTGVGATAYVVTEDTTNHLNTLTPYTATPFQSVTSTDNSNFAYNVRQLQMALRLTF